MLQDLMSWGVRGCTGFSPGCPAGRRQNPTTGTLRQALPGGWGCPACAHAGGLKCPGWGAASTGTRRVLMSRGGADVTPGNRRWQVPASPRAPRAPPVTALSAGLAALGTTKPSFGFHTSGGGGAVSLEGLGDVPTGFAAPPAPGVLPSPRLSRLRVPVGLPAVGHPPAHPECSLGFWGRRRTLG